MDLDADNNDDDEEKEDMEYEDFLNPKFDPFDDEGDASGSRFIVGRIQNQNDDKNEGDDTDVDDTGNETNSFRKISNQLFNSEENKYFSLDDFSDDTSDTAFDDLDEVVDFYYDPVRNKMIERKLTEKQKAKIRKQRAAIEAYKDRKEREKMEKLKIKQERQKKRQERIDRRMRIKKEAEMRKNERRLLKRNKMLERAKAKASDHLGIRNDTGDIESDLGGLLSIHTLVYEELVDIYLREQIELESMREEAIRESKLFITRRVASDTLSFISDDTTNLLHENSDDEISSASLTNGAFKLRERFSLRRSLVTSLAFSDSRFNLDELEILTDDDLRRILRIRGYDHIDNQDTVLSREDLISDLRKSYRVNTVPWV